jgi:hypothetical protein
MNFRVRHFLIGITLGIIIPMVAFYLFYIANYSHIPFADYIKMLSMRSKLSKVMSICAVPNLLCFYICLWTNRDNMARGILGGTMLTALTVVVIYFIF